MMDFSVVCSKSDMYYADETTFTDDSLVQCDCHGARICESNGTAEDVFLTSIRIKLEESHAERSDTVDKEVEDVIADEYGTVVPYEVTSLSIEEYFYCLLVVKD
jgi:hypothetical protein